MSDYNLSRALAKALRHNPRVPMDSEGWSNIPSLHKYFVQNGQYSGPLGDFRQALQRVTDGNDKQRFKIDSGRDAIRANQGHSLGMKVTLDLEPITSHVGIYAIHGTTQKAWRLIKTQGLDRMQRQHIHFAPSISAVSGIRWNAEVLIHLDVEKWLADGHTLFRSSNGVLLTSEHVDPEYFRTIDQFG